MNTIFNASAGTGKTYQVTELYAALVLGTHDEHLSPVAPEKILLMTFTENAAAELRQRVSEKLIAAEEENDLARSVLRRLPAANISTIHAFCAGVLREHALELGLSPSFQTLENEERDDFLEEVLKAEIFQCLETDPNFRQFCAGLSILGDFDNSVLNTIRFLLDKAASRGLDLSNAEAMLPDVVPSIGRNHFQKIHDELEQYDLPATASKALGALKLFLSDFPNLGKLEAVKKFGQAKKVKHLSDELAELKERFVNETRYAENVEPFRAFARCLQNCSVAFAEAKRARDCVDFGDQLLLTRDLLAKSGEYPFEWIIVDEVQDTSRVQCDVIQSLWGPQTSLVICGDKKQSIYAWRSADPDVMPDLEKAMAERGDYQQIPLSTSRRSKPQVVDAVNELFDPIYDSYDALAPLDPLPDEGPCVEFLDVDNEEQSTEEEMAAVARRIQALVNGSKEWRPRFGYDCKTFAAGQGVKYGDILILLKRSTHQRALENALREAGIAYTSGGKGKALFEQQEVRDLLLFLQVITQPHNDLALLGFLRSPFAGLSDDEIVQLGWGGTTFDREILRRQFFETEKAELVLRYRAQTGEKLASQLIRDVVRETAFDAHLAGQPGGEQKLANFKKALDWIRNAERGGQVLIGDVVRRFEQAIKSPPSSGAAEALLPNPEQDAVTIMTVHGAKGLSKRVCFVPDISFGGTSDKAFAVFGENSLELKLRGLASEEIVSPGWNAARDADKAVRDAESLNVFYVAMTRARDLVVLSGAGTKDSKGWKKDAAEFLENAPASLLRRLPFSEITMFGKTKSTQRGEKQVSFQPLEILPSVERKAVTALVAKPESRIPNLESSGDRRSLGTLGHEILEELALNRWVGDIPELEDKNLARQLEVARDVLRAETAGADELFAEFPFVLKRGDVILDGTMDLLVKFSPSGSLRAGNDPPSPGSGATSWKIYDYKFSNASPEAVLKTYSPQLEAYKEAVEKLHPGETVAASLVLIGETVELISLRA